MDVLDFINRGGQKEVRNPLFNPKSKKNIVPRTITVDDLDADNDAAVNMAVTDYQKQFSIDSKEADKYRKQGINWNPWENLDKQLADQQSAWTKWGNALAQTVVSEIGLGTLKGISDLFDLLGEAIGVNDGDYSNPVSQYLEEKQEEFRNYAAIHTDPNLNISNGGLLDAGWWASNIPSVASSLTLLIPSTGVTKGLSMAGKALNVGGKTASFTRKITGASKAINNGKKLNKFQRFMNSEGTANATKLFLENGTTAVLSRAIENYQEARQTYNDMYTQAYDSFKQMSDEEYQQVIDGNAEMLKEQGIDPNNKDEVAKAIAKQSADVTFRTDWLNVGWDVLQMYALRNAWKGLRNAPENSAAVRRAQKDAIKYAGQYTSEAELAALKAKRKFGEKAKEWIGDRLYGSKLLLTAEASEGAEEALNYIAQQEGMHFGNVLLGKEDGDKHYSVWENVFNGFDGRLSQYIQAPELWDSAFWGVMGGVVFQSLGGQFRRIANKLTDEKSDANEESKQSLPWYQLDELPETKRRISEIHARAIDAKQYKDFLDRINAGEDIYKSTKDNKVEFTNEYEQQAARDKLKNEFIAKMTLRAMNTGNLDMLKEYLGSDEVRKAMVEQGFFGQVSDTRSTQEIEADSKKYIDDALDRMEKVEEMYDNELIAVNEASAYINKYSEYGGSVPVEYMQIIANNNVNAMLSMEAMDSELIGINERIAQLENQFADKLDSNINYSSNIRVGVLTNELGHLRAERKRLIEDESNSLSNQISIAEIDKRIASIESYLDDVELAYATFMSLRFTKTDNGEFIQEDTPEAFAYRDQMIIRQGEKTVGEIYNLNGLEKFGLSDRPIIVLDDASIGKYHTLENDARTTFNELRNISPELDNLYQRRAAIEISRDFTNLGIARTVNEVTDQIGILHNTMSEARTKAISTANKTIQSLYRKYGNNVKDYIFSYSININKDFKPEGMSDAEIAELKDALDVLALTKSYNQSLIYHLDRLFELQDAIRAGQSVENSTSENGISADENGEVDNISADGTIIINGDENSQNDDVSGITDPQQTDNRQPTFYAKFRNDRKGNRYIFHSGSHSNTDNGGVAVYDNGDGTFTIDVRDNPSLKKNTNMFSNAKKVDVTRPNEVVIKPIARRNAKGKLEIVQPGELRNTDTLEAQQALSEETTTEQAPTSGEQAAPSGSTIPSTGEGVESGSTTASAEQTTTSQPATPAQPASTGSVTNGEYVIEQAPADDSIRNEALSRFQQAVRENKDADLDAVAKELIDGYVATGIDRVLAETAVNKSKNIIKRVLERKRKASAPTMQSSVDDIILTQSSIIEAPNSMDAIQAYKASVKQLMNQYAKELGIQRINGLLYVNLEDLLRYCNSVTTDSSTAGMIYESLKEYLKTDEAKKDFIIMDENTVDNSNFLSNVAKSEEERYLERLGDTSIQRVDINYLVRNAESNKEIDDFYDALDSLNVGDKLTYDIFNGKIYIRNNKGQAVGTMPIPKIDKSTGAYIMYNDGWKTDVLASNNGNIGSSLKDLFIRWFISKSKDSKEISDVIHELAYTKPSKEREDQLYTILRNNPEWEAAVKQGFTRDTASVKELANHLTKILKFINQNSGVSQTVRDIQLRKSIDNWFKKLNSSYDAVTAMAHGQNFNISVGTISDGELIRIVENDKVQAEQQAIPANEAIAGGVNPAIHKIGIADKYNVGMIRVSGMPQQGLAGVGGGNTFVIIPNRSGRPGYVQAFPAEVTDDYIGKEAKDMIQAIHDEINRLLDAHASNPSETTYKNLYEFFEKLLVNNNTTSNLFNGLAFTKDKYGNGFSISIPRTANFIRIFEKANNGKISTLIQIGDEEFEVNKSGKKTKNFSYNDAAARDAISRLINNLKFKINYTYIDSDNRANMTLKGFARRENGKFIISIGDKTWTYHSYNDFILRNNLVRLNTKPSEDGRSNYSRKGQRTQKANQVFEIKIDRVTTSPVEGSQEQVTEPAQPATPTNIPVTEQVQNILASNSTDKGVDIVRAIIGTDSIFTEDTLKAFQNLGILPKNIKFDAEFNNRPNYENINAETNPTTGEVTVGKRWLNMFNNPISRRQAIRKLIHEQLHNKLYKNKGYIRSAQQIYDEFKAAIENGELERKGFNKDVIEHLKQYLFEGDENGLEEFLVESLTSEELATALNSIDATFDKKRGAKNLFQKILELMSKVFGWNIRQGSLYEKELHTLRNIMNDNVEDRQAIEETTEIINKIHQDGEKANLTPDEVYYANEETGRLGIRVTSAIQADEENTEEKINEDGTKQRIPKRFDKNSPWITPSTNIGTGIDEFTRDFFLGKLDNLTEDELETQYPNVTGNDWVAFREQLKQFRDNLRSGKTIKGKNITIVSRDIKAIGQVDVTMPDGTVKKLDVTGTLDLLGYDQDGKFYIFDMKTVHSDNYLSDTEKSKKWNRQLQLYKQCLVDKYGIDVAGTYIIPIKVNYDTPKGAKHKDGTDMGGKTEYTVRNPELKTQYDNPMRSQILQNGEEFRDAAPELRPILEKKPKPGNIKYEYLDDAAKAVLDGTVTIDNYKQQEATTETKQEHITVEPVEVQKPAVFGKDNSRKMRGRFRSSVTELNTTENYTQEMQSIKEQAIADGSFMKAPNGKPTNLNERQWLQVRTKAFKDWFGDWEVNAPIKELPTEYAYRFTDINELNDVLEYGDFRSIPEEKTIEGAENAIKSKNGRSFSIGKVYGNSHGGKGFAAGVNWKESGGTVTTGTAQKVIIGIPGKNTLWQVGHHGKYSTATDFNNIEKGKPLFIKFDENGDANIPLDGMKVYIQREDGMYVPYNTNNNASKVVDENGEPLVVWHGNRTNNSITVFDKNKKGSEHKERSISGFWFITDKEIAKIEYAIKPESIGKGEKYLEYGEVIPVFLNIKNPVITEQQGITINDTPYGLFTTAKENIDDFIERSKNNSNENTDGYILTLIDSDNRADDYVSKQTQLVVNNPNQIKSATSNNGDFSTTNDDIRYSSVTEQPIKVPSITSFEERLSVQQQPKFASLVARGEISTYCR